ncbi:MAG TPA: ATP-grasp domain-containing protein [Gemmatimonadales bacterium]|nr:ATP-grasp domain-containing protein [Gemmatimonadales bacterium]
MRVVILYDAGSPEWTAADVAAVLQNVHEVRDALRRRGHDVELAPVRLGDFRWLTRARRADAVFNLCEGINGHARYEDFVVGTLELTGVPFTGCRAWPTTVCHRKHVANTLLASAGVPVPAFALAQGNRVPADFPLPAIVKPAAEDASVGIDANAVCTTRKALKKRVAWLAEQFEEVIVQQYVAGREVNVGFVGRQVLPLSEIDFGGMPAGSWPIVTYQAKWAPGHPEYAGTVPVCPARLPADLARRIVAVARQAWEYMAGGEGYGRVDLRVGEDGQPYVLEVNPCPDLSSDAGLARMAAAFGWDYEELVAQVLDEALTRSRHRDAAAALAESGTSSGSPSGSQSSPRA